MKLKPFEWESVKVKINLIDPTPVNYKILNALGLSRLQHLLAKFGMAGNVILNPSGKYSGPKGYKGRFVLIDGNSRITEARKKKKDFVWASVPNRRLNDEEFKEFSAMFDYGKAGDVDIERISADYSTQSDFFKAYNMQIPEELLATMGAKAGKITDYPGGKSKTKAEPELVDTKMVQLFFDTKSEELFRKWEEKIMRRFKTSNTTATVLAAFKSLAK